MTIKKMNLIYLMVLSVLILISCADTTTNNDTGPCITSYGPETPQNKTELKAAVDKFYAECQNQANYSLIDVSAITDMSELFKDNTSFNGDISMWNTSNVTDMGSMFHGATAFNRDISNWEISGVENVNSMFESATAFDQDLSGWSLKAGVVVKEPAAPTKMFYLSGMRPKMLPTMNFYQYTPADRAALKTAINAETNKQGDEPDLSIIDTSRVIDMNSLFANRYENFNGYITTWDTSSVTNMHSMFYVALNFNQPIGDWDTSKVTDMHLMFSVAFDFNQPIGDWDTSKVSTFNGMFAGAISFNQNLTRWKHGTKLSTSTMFHEVEKMSEANKAPWMPKNGTIKP